MLKLKEENLFIRKFKSLCFKTFNALENNNNPNFYHNGESLFIKMLLSSLPTNDPIIFDVGSNVGIYIQAILEYSKISEYQPTIYSFEPTKSCSNQLQKHFADNQNIILNNFGLSDRETEATIYYDAQTSGLASLYQRNLKHYNRNLSIKETIKLKRLDNYIEENKITHINLLKVDIEGHELFSFYGLGDYLSPKFIDAIQFEYGGANLDSHTSLIEIFDLLNSTGFELYKVMSTYLQRREYNPSMENFQYANYVALSKEFIKILNQQKV